MPSGDADEIVARCALLAFFGDFLATRAFFDCLTLIRLWSWTRAPGWFRFGGP
jgi:hypothetical protein